MIVNNTIMVEHGTFLESQCNNCSSFNTVVERIIMSGEEAHEFLGGYGSTQATFRVLLTQMPSQPAVVSVDAVRTSRGVTRNKTMYPYWWWIP
jgi:hypothetical protein